MRSFRIYVFVICAICSASPALAQYGLYGAPDVLDMPQTADASYLPAAHYQTAYYPAQQAPARNYPAYQPTTPYRPAQRSVGYTPYQSYQPYKSYPSYQPYRTVPQRAYPNQYPTPHQYPNTYSRQASRPAAPGQPAAQPMPIPPGIPTGPTPAPNALRPQPQPQGLDALNQLEQSGYGSYGGYNDGGYGACSPYPAPGGCGPCGCESYFDGCGGCCAPETCPVWYGSVCALVMSRSDARRVWTSYATDEETDQLENTQFGLSWKWGGEVRFGRRFCWCCTPFALEATYWTTEAFSGYQSTTNPGNFVSTPLVIRPMTFGGASAQDWFDGAQEHRLWRKDEFHNVELNLIRQQLVYGNSPWEIGWLVGFRYFRFRDDLTFGSLRDGGVWGQNGGADEAYLGYDVTNNLFGFQLGFDMAYNTPWGLRLFVDPKAGIFANHLEGTFTANTGNGINGVGPYGSYPVHSVRDGVSFIGQLDAGVEWRFTRHLSARAGYRVMAITGTGLADDQIPQYIVDTVDIVNIQHYSSLVLHGAFLGVSFEF